MNRLKELRDKKGISQSQFVHEFNEFLISKKMKPITIPTYSRWENSLNSPTEKVWQQLADYFGTSVSYIRGDLDTEMLAKIINTIYLIICNRISMHSERETIDNTEDSRTIVATELMLLMYQVLNLDHNKQFKEIVSKNANLLGIKGKAKLDYIKDSLISATDENYQSDIENAKAWIKFYEDL